MSIEKYFLPFPEIVSERVLLRRCEVSDAEEFFELAKNPELTVNLSWDYHKSINETRGFIQQLQEEYEKERCKTWAICERSENRFIGMITLRTANFQLRGEVGYWIGVPYWNKGYMSEALAALLDFCFGVLELNRVQAEHFVCNPASGRVMEKCGMSYEGTLRGYIFCGEEWHDCRMFSVLRSEWENRLSECFRDDCDGCGLLDN